MATEQQELGTDPRLPVTTCRGPNCGAETIWVQTPAGKWTPVDAKPVRMYVLGQKPVFNASQLEGRPASLTSGHVPHWATCPDRERFGQKAKVTE